MGSEAAVFIGQHSSCVLLIFAFQTNICFVYIGSRFPDQTSFDVSNICLLKSSIYTP